VFSRFVSKAWADPEFIGDSVLFMEAEGNGVKEGSEGFSVFALRIIIEEGLLLAITGFGICCTVFG
jgi:hypothetical protein